MSKYNFWKLLIAIRKNRLVAEGRNFRNQAQTIWTSG